GEAGRRGFHLDVVAGLEAHIPTAILDVVAHVERRDAGDKDRLDVAEATAGATRLRATADIPVADCPTAADDLVVVLRADGPGISQIAVVDPAQVFLARDAVREGVEIHA